MTIPTEHQNLLATKTGHQLEVELSELLKSGHFDFAQLAFRLSIPALQLYQMRDGIFTNISRHWTRKTIKRIYSLVRSREI